MSRSLPSHSCRLSEMVHRPGGLTASEAVRAAEARLDTMRDSSVKELAAMVERMIAAGDELSASPDAQRLNALYAMSNTVVGVAGVFGMPELGEVAFSLCRLLDQQRSSAAYSIEAIQLHLNSLRLMSAGEDSGLKRSVIKALHQVVERVSRQATPKAV